jgi:phage terminase large subunit-like protein
MTAAFLGAAGGPHGTTLLGQLDRRSLRALNADFPTFHHPGQLPPEGDWRTWLIIAGRGFGKTRAGAEWVLSLVRGNQSRARSASTGSGRTEPLRIALVAATIDESRRVMVEGPSGLLRLAAQQEITDWSPSRRTLSFAGGAEAILYSGANPESLRGPEHHFAWADELAKWKHPADTWDNLQLGLRMGDHPRAVVTTTPKPSVLLHRLRGAPDSVETGGATGANPHLPPSFVAAMQAQYGGTRAGLQEIEGRLLDDIEGSLWPVKLIERCRVTPPAGFSRIVIGVDPPASANGTCGIVVCALARDGNAYVIADCSVSGASPEGWARAVADAAARFDADRVVAEQNQGGAMV